MFGNIVEFIVLKPLSLKPITGFAFHLPLLFREEEVCCVKLQNLSCDHTGKLFAYC